MNKLCYLQVILHLVFAVAAAAAERSRSPITNGAEWRDGRPVALPGARRVKVETAFLYRPETEWTYSHHPSITFFKGRYFAIWSNGRKDEDAPGQRVLMSTSTDFQQWTAPRPLVDSTTNSNGVERVLTAAGFHPHAGTLVAYFGNYGPRKETTRLQAVTTTDGDHWSAVRDLGIPVNPNHPPQRTASGRLILCGNISFPWTDDPSGLTGWQMTGIYPASMAATIKDDPASFWEVARQQAWPAALCEGSFIQTGDGVLHCLLRNTGSQFRHRLWVTESRDDGATWSAPVETDFSDTDAKFHFGRLPDGRFYYVGNPVGGGRTPLVLSLSRDGVRFDDHYILGGEPYSLRQPGRAKGGEYGYPHTLIQDGHLCVIVSRQKEAVQVLRLPLSELNRPRFDQVPGVVIDHSPASSGLYIGSPSLAVWTNGNYLASHDFFGPKSAEFQRARSVVFRSSDRGQTWKQVAEIQGAFWSSLFVHRGAVYLLGPDRHHGNILIRRSTDGGETWTIPTNAATGLLRDNGEYHCAPMPVLEHNGRLWRAFEWRHPPVAWGINYRAGMLSVPVDADLLQADNWLASNFLPSDRAWNQGDMGAWLEGNAVIAPDGEMLDVLRVQTRSPDEKAALVRISADGRTASFDPATGFVPFPGGAKKFAIRFDPKSKKYWSIASIVHERHRAENPGGIRNALALTCSPDLTNWTVRCILLYHPDVARHGFQYVDWLFEGDDLIAACRTAYDDGLGGARNNHDANFLTFHRFANFRERTMADSVPQMQP